MRLGVVILAAGLGTRMKSTLPKVMHVLAGKTLLTRVIETASMLNPHKIFLVLGFGAELIKQYYDHPNFSKIREKLVFVHQAEQLGTGHAVLQTLPHYSKRLDKILVLYGDVPCIKKQTLDHLWQVASSSPLSLLTIHTEKPQGLGRILRAKDNPQEIIAIVEEKDASSEQKKIQEIWTGALIADRTLLEAFLPKLNNQNNQKELYLTDIVAHAKEAGLRIDTVEPKYDFEISGVNDPLQLATLERKFQVHQAENLAKEGLYISDTQRFDLRGDLKFKSDCKIDVGVILEGAVILGRNVSIGPYCYLKDVEIQDNTNIQAHTIIEGAKIGSSCNLGPFARIRPGTELFAESKVGNFVEIKKSVLKNKVKVNHLSYIGDAEIGENTNIGAGTITCNYDGKNKHPTKIGAYNSIGANSALIAPIETGDHVALGAGTILTKNINSNKLVYNKISRQEFEKTNKK
ncbi:MAG: bifunctional UDP-N-acetylglucosamine diphosphorylase/glucosamine-1-phosphate N-acetyltransferase GlmU [Gammaproteobacteria bacterium]